MTGSTEHASAVLAGATALLIRGGSGSGKSLLAWRMIDTGGDGRLPFVRLIGDDRVILAARHERLLVRPAPALQGLLEIRSLGLRRLPFEPVARVALVVDLGVPSPARLPEPEDCVTDIAGVRLPRLAVAAGIDPLPLVLARLKTAPVGFAGA